MSSHRVSPFKTADQIIVLDLGRVDEIGKYEELEKTNSYFKWLVETQTQNN